MPGKVSAPNRIRTCGLLLRRQTLYPLSYRGVPVYPSSLLGVPCPARGCEPREIGDEWAREITYRRRSKDHWSNVCLAA